MRRIFAPLFRFSGDEQEPPAAPPLQAGLASHDQSKADHGPIEPGDSDAGMFRNFQDSAVPRSKTLFLVLGAVCIGALFGAAWYIATDYHSKHRRSKSQRRQPRQPP